MPPQNNLNNTNNNQNKPETKTPAIRTLKTDITEASQKTSLSDIYQKQQKKRVVTTTETKKFPIKKFFIWGGSGLALLTILALLLFLFFKKEPAEQVEISQKPESIITSGEEIVLNIKNKEELKEKIIELSNKTRVNEGFVFLPVKTDDTFLTSKDFFNLTQSSAPTILKTFIEEDFFLGLLNTQKTYPVLIFKIDNIMYNSVFSGMLRWEKNIPQDLDFIFKKQPTTTQLTTFKDKIIKNQSARVVEEGGEILFLYTIFDKNYLIITNDTEALDLIIKQIALF